MQMFADEKGYLVTEMVWEEVTDDEGDSAAATEQPVKRQKESDNTSAGAATNKDKKAPVPATKLTAKKTTGEPPKPQKNMMSFFTKKA